MSESGIAASAKPRSNKALLRSLDGLFMVVALSGTLAWLFGWEAVYRPIPDGPVLSPFTLLLFAVLFLIQHRSTNQSSDGSQSLSRVILIMLLTGLVIAALIVRFTMSGHVLGMPVSSIPTIMTVAALLAYEVVKSRSSQPNIKVYLILLPSLIWIYLSVVGYVSGELFLTGAIAYPDIGVSLPTILLSVIYLTSVFSQKSYSLTAAHYRTISWVRKALNSFIIFLFVFPLIVAGILRFLITPNASNELGLYIMLLVFLATIILFLIGFMWQLSATHNKIQVICSYSRQLKQKDGEWQSLEAYLYDNYGVQLSHGVTEEMKKKLLDDLDDNK